MYQPEGSEMQYFIKQKYLLKEKVRKTHKINQMCVLLVSEIETKCLATLLKRPKLKVILHHEGYSQKL